MDTFRLVLCAGLVACGVALPSCETEVRTSNNSECASEVASSECASEVAPRETDEPLPPGWERQPDGSLVVHVVRRPSAMAEFLTERFALREITVADDGRVTRFTILAANPGYPDGVHEAARVVLDRRGSIVSMTPRPTQGAAADCWMTVTITGSSSTYLCNGACNTPGWTCTPKYNIVGDTTIIWYECAPPPN